MPVHVVFVCMGNICRSPMAEAIFMDKVQRAGLERQITADSCGTGGWHAGDAPHPGTQRILREHGIPSNHQARQITRGDLRADYLIAMDRENLDGIRQLGDTSAEVGLLLDYVPELNVREVPDPYYSEYFDETYRLIEVGCEKLLAHIRRQNNL